MNDRMRRQHYAHVTTGAADDNRVDAKRHSWKRRISLSFLAPPILPPRGTVEFIRDRLK